MLDLAILGLLTEGDLHGYEIRRRLRDSLGLLANVSFGSLYPALARLEAAGAVESVEPAAPVTPVPAGLATGSLSGELAALRARRAGLGRPKRSKKVYRITDTGRQLFATLLDEPAPTEDARSFSLRLSLASHLSPERRLGLLERRRNQLRSRLDEVVAGTAGAELDAYQRSVVDHTADSVRADIAWLDGLVAFERDRQHHQPGADEAVSAGTDRT